MSLQLVFSLILLGQIYQVASTGISLTRQPRAILNDNPYVHKVGRTEILRRLLADKCELCESTENVEVHVRRFGGRDRAHQMV